MPYKVNPITGSLDYYEVLPAGSGRIVSVPPTDCYPVTNLFVTSGGNLQVEWDDSPTTGGEVYLGTVPPQGATPVVNLYVNNGKLVVEYDDES